MPEPAPLKARLAALLIDRAFILAVGLFPVLYVELLVATSDRIVVNPYFPPLFVPWLLSFYGFYGLLVEGLCGGRTLGKRLLGLRVVDEAGRPIGLRAGLVRNLLRAVDSVPLFLYAVGLLLARRGGRRFGDRVARTRVVRDPSPGQVRWAPLAVAFLVVVVAPNLLLPVALRSDGATRAPAAGPFLKGIVVSHWSNDSGERAKMLDRIQEAGFNAIRFHDFRDLPSPEVLREMAARNFTVILGTGETWAVRRSPEDARRMVALYGNISAIAYWNIGNEDYSPDLTIPKDHLRAVNDAFRAADPRPTIFSNHMVLHAPDLIPFGSLGYGPVEFTDAYGFNAYPTSQAVTLVHEIHLWENNTLRSVDPATGAFLKGTLGLYFLLEPVLFEPFNTSTFGYGYWLYSYIAFGKLRERPVYLTEFGGNADVAYARGQWGVIRKFPEFRGAFFYHWDTMDPGNNGTVADGPLFRFFQEEAR